MRVAVFAFYFLCTYRHHTCLMVFHLRRHDLSVLPALVIFKKLFSEFLITELDRYRGMVIVKYSSVIDAEEAVKCEHGTRNFGSHIRVFHPDSELMRHLCLISRKRKESSRRSTSSRSGSSGKPPRV